MIRKRIDVKLDYSCNNNCKFCGEADNRSLQDKTTKKVKQELMLARSNYTEVVLTGGEPTIRRDIFEIIFYAKKLGFSLIQLQTNARMFSYGGFTRKMFNAKSLRKRVQCFVSIQGHNHKIHDFLTRVDGSFEQTIRGIDNLKKYNVFLITDTVITKQNYKFLPDIAKFLISLGVDDLQFCFVHPMGNAWRYFDEVVPKISDVAPYVHKAIDIGEKSRVNVRVEGIPFCFMEDYESNILETYLRPKNLERLDCINRKSLESHGRTKRSKCFKCRYYNVCLGTWREYVDKRRFDEFRPVFGKSIMCAKDVIGKDGVPIIVE